MDFLLSEILDRKIFLTVMIVKKEIFKNFIQCKAFQLAKFLNIQNGKIIEWVKIAPNFVFHGSQPSYQCALTSFSKHLTLIMILMILLM